MSRIHSGRRWRLPGLAVVIVALVLAGVADTTMRARPGVRDGGRFAGGLPEQAMALTSRHVSSSAWYCAGPLPVGPTKEASSIAVANLGSHRARGQLVVSAKDGRRRAAPIVVAPHAEAVYGLPRTGAHAGAAATVLVDSASVGVEEVIHGPYGPLASPCSITTGKNQYLAVGSTKGADNVALAVYDPGATPAVVSVTFATTTGGAAPPAFQGIDVAPGHVVVLDVGHEVPSRLAVAAIVHATGGRVVAGAVVRSVVDHSLLGSLITASAWDSHRWELPAAPLGAAARQGFSVLNPTSRTARVVLHLIGSSAGKITEVVPPGAVVDVGPAVLGSLATTAATLSSRGAPVVVARELALSATGPEPHPLHHLPALPKGFAAASGTTAPFRRWLLPGGESDARVGEVVTVANPNHTPAVVELRNLSGAPVASGRTRYRLAPGASTVFSLSSLPGVSGRVPVVVSSTSPVVAGEVLYAKGHQGLGLTAAPAIPVG